MEPTLKSRDGSFLDSNCYFVYEEVFIQFILYPCRMMQFIALTFHNL